MYEKGPYGKRAVLTGPWVPGLETHLTRHGVAELELNMGKGWRGTDVDFIQLLPDLQALGIFDHFYVKSVAAIHHLHKLRSLAVETYCRTPIDFSAFPLLEDCTLQWRARSWSLFDRVGLRRLAVIGFKKRTFEDFARLTNLEQLTILGAPLENVEGIGGLKNLTYLRIGNMYRLQSIQGLEGAEHLRELWIQDARHLTSLEGVEKLKELRRLQLDNCRRIESLKPLERLPSLNTVVLIESNVVDGDMTPLLTLPALRRARVAGKHYSHSEEELREILDSRQS